MDLIQAIVLFLIALAITVLACGIKQVVDFIKDIPDVKENYYLHFFK